MSENCLICGIDTIFDSLSGSDEIRTPYANHTYSSLDKVLSHMDREAKRIDNWQQLYQWLGTGSGSSFFTEEAAARLAAHWLSKDRKLRCHHLEVEDGTPMIDVPFIDVNLRAVGISPALMENIISSWESISGDSDPRGQLHELQIETNMVITQQELFSQQSA